MNRAVWAEALLMTPAGWAATGVHCYPSGRMTIRRQGDGERRLMWTDKNGRSKEILFRGNLYLTSETDAS